MVNIYGKWLFIFLLIHHGLSAQVKQQVKIHSHNDYAQKIPFWTAYGNGSSSIEVDVFLKEGTIYATHAEADIKVGHTLESLYLEPLQHAITLGLGDQQPLQLLIDVKSEAIETLLAIIGDLDGHLELIVSQDISFVISGNRPPPENFSDYPEYILFDYQSLEDFPDDKIGGKVALISLNFKNFSNWNGEGSPSPVDLEKVSSTIKKAHSLGKSFRFWGCPDTETAWKTFAALGVDFINTDHPDKVALFLKVLNKDTP